MSNVEGIKQATDRLVSGSDQLLGSVQAQQRRVVEITNQVSVLTTDVSILTFSSSILETLLKTISVESLNTVEQLVTYGLRVVFPDLSLNFKTDISTKRGAQWLDLKLEDNGVEAPILSAFGGGPASVVAFLLRLLVCRRLNLAPVLLLDEPFSFVSEHYVENVGKLLRELADKLGFEMILVTHADAFLKHANVAYEASPTSKGTVFTKVKTED